MVSPRVKNIAALLQKKGAQRFRLQQILQGVYVDARQRWMDIPNLPTKLKRDLVEEFGDRISSLTPISEVADPEACKQLFSCAPATEGKCKTGTSSSSSSTSSDAPMIEAVSLNFVSHRSLCISSQAGCAFKCAFCATGSMGFTRHLTADEIADQVLFFKRMNIDRKEPPIDSISVMGMGEALANPKIFDALEVMTNRHFMGLSQRRINVSTVGVLPGIKQLLERFPQVNLAFSLHSPFPEERDVLIPLNKLYPFEEVFKFLDERIVHTGRRLWISYILLPDTNDSIEHARALVDIIQKRPISSRHLYHVNLLPYNTTDLGQTQGWSEKSKKVKDFMNILTKQSISVSYRNSFGHDINAACGQLITNAKKGGQSSSTDTMRVTKGRGSASSKRCSM